MKGFEDEGNLSNCDSEFLNIFIDVSKIIACPGEKLPSIHHHIGINKLQKKKLFKYKIHRKYMAEYLHYITPIPYQVNRKRRIQRKWLTFSLCLELTMRLLALPKTR